MKTNPRSPITFHTIRLISEGFYRFTIRNLGHLYSSTYLFPLIPSFTLIPTISRLKFRPSNRTQWTHPGYTSVSGKFVSFPSVLSVVVSLQYTLSELLGDDQNFDVLPRCSVPYVLRRSSIFSVSGSREEFGDLSLSPDDCRIKIGSL